jgi:hypothetical protein
LATAKQNRVSETGRSLLLIMEQIIIQAILKIKAFVNPSHEISEAMCKANKSSNRTPKLTLVHAI